MSHRSIRVGNFHQNALCRWFESQPPSLHSSSAAISSVGFFNATNFQNAKQFRYLHDDHDDFDDQNDGSRVFVDNDLALEEKANVFINVPIGTMHAKDVLLKSQDIILDLCRSRKDNKIWVSKAEEILHRILEEKRFVNDDPSRPAILLPALFFETVLFGWGKIAHRGPEGMEHMRSILEQMKKEDEKDQTMKKEQPHRMVMTTSDIDLTLGEVENMGCQPSLQTFKAYHVGLQYAAQSYPLEVKKELFKTIDEMESLAKTQGYKTKPNTKAYTQVMFALSKTKLRVDEDVMRMFKRMKVAHDAALKEYNAKSDIPYNYRDPAANIHQIVTPDAQAYTALLMSFIGSGNPFQIEKIMNEMMYMYDGTVQPDVYAFTVAIDTLAKSVRRQKSPKDRADIAHKAEQLLWMMVKHTHMMNKEIVIDDDDRDANELDHSTTTSESETIFDVDDQEDSEISDDITRLKREARKSGLERPIAAFNATINAWAQSDVKESAENAQRILNRILTEKIVKPDLTTFNSVINAWSRAIHDPTAPIKVGEILELMYEMVEAKSLYKSDRPDKYSYSTLIMAWAKSKNPESVVMARAALDDQLQVYLAGDSAAKPGIVSYTGVLTAARSSEPLKNEDGFEVHEERLLSTESKDPYRIAMAIYTDIITDKPGLGLKADHIVFSEMLEVISKHNDPRSTERQSMTRHVFDAASAAGECSTLVIRALTKACPNKELLNVILKDIDIENFHNIDQLPSEWIKNVSRLPAHRLINKKGGVFTSRTKDFPAKKEGDTQESVSPASSTNSNRNGTSYNKPSTSRNRSSNSNNNTNRGSNNATTNKSNSSTSNRNYNSTDKNNNKSTGTNNNFKRTDQSRSTGTNNDFKRTDQNKNRSTGTNNNFKCTDQNNNRSTSTSTNNDSKRTDNKYSNNFSKDKERQSR